jgi:hypothetical protein
MSKPPSPLDSWSSEQVAQGRRWVRTWQEEAPRLEAIRREELRRLDTFTAISWLCGETDYTVAPRGPKPTSGLIEQQRLFAWLRQR